jgi:hypothetical protein
MYLDEDKLHNKNIHLDVTYNFVVDKIFNLKMFRVIKYYFQHSNLEI